MRDFCDVREKLEESTESAFLIKDMSFLENVLSRGLHDKRQDLFELCGKSDRKTKTEARPGVQNRQTFIIICRQISIPYDIHRRHITRVDHIEEMEMF